MSGFATALNSSSNKRHYMTSEKYITTLFTNILVFANCETGNCCQKSQVFMQEKQLLIFAIVICLLRNYLNFRSSHRRCSVKKVFLEISQNSKENTLVRVAFLIKLQASVCNFIKNTESAKSVARAESVFAFTESAF